MVLSDASRHLHHEPASDQIKTKFSMPGDNVLSAGAAAAVWAIWTAIELAARRRRIPSRDYDKGSLVALKAAHGFRLVGMLVGFLGVGRIDGAGALLRLSGLGLMFAGIAVPDKVLTLPILAVFTVSIAHFASLYHLRVKIPASQAFGSVFAAMSVQWTVARAVGFGLIKDRLPEADMILCRDCLVHFAFDDVFRALRNIAASGATYLVTTHFEGDRENRDIITGEWRPLNLERRPFGFPPPLRLINENCTEGGGNYADKSLGIWRISDLPAALRAP